MGVSVRTVYRNFPKRSDLIAAIIEAIDESTGPGMPESLDDLPVHMKSLFAWFEETPTLIEAAHATNLGREVRMHGRRGRGAKARDDRRLDGGSARGRARARCA